RFLLALKVVLADRGSAPTLVFDEIDTGAGGAVADAVGQRLARLAARGPGVAVTHAPPVAARAGRPYLIPTSARAPRERTAACPMHPQRPAGVSCPRSARAPSAQPAPAPPPGAPPAPRGGRSVPACVPVTRRLLHPPPNGGGWPPQAAGWGAGRVADPTRLLA